MAVAGIIASAFLWLVAELWSSNNAHIQRLDERLHDLEISHYVVKSDIAAIRAQIITNTHDIDRYHPYDPAKRSLP